jgi:hypothetical protein
MTTLRNWPSTLISEFMTGQGNEMACTRGIAWRFVVLSLYICSLIFHDFTRLPDASVSGHGCQVKDDNGEEMDLFDEGISSCSALF